MKPLRRGARAAEGLLLLATIGIEAGGNYVLALTRGQAEGTEFQQTFARASELAGLAAPLADALEADLAALAVHDRAAHGGLAGQREGERLRPAHRHRRRHHRRHAASCSGSRGLTTTSPTGWRRWRRR